VVLPSELEAVKSRGLQFPDVAKQPDQPFNHEEKLATAAKRQQEIIAALDITKNQAAATIDEGITQNSEGYNRS